MEPKRTVEIAAHAGFCFGVNRAIKLAESSRQVHDTKIYSYGPLIHNPDEINRLIDLGIYPIDDIKSLRAGDKLLIRSHGAGKWLYDLAKEMGVEIIEATCPFVKKVHRIVDQAEDTIIIVGDPQHPEIIGVKGWCHQECYVVSTLNDVAKLPKQEIKKAVIVAQTTLRYEKFQEIVTALKTFIPQLVVENTICSATTERQNAVIDLAKKVELMIVIGGKASSNTKKLAEISQKYAKETLLIENSFDLKMKVVQKYVTIGITAGASTPQWVIDKVVEKLFNEREDY